MLSLLGLFTLAFPLSLAAFPPELFSPLIPEKILETSQTMLSASPPTRYPQFTTSPKSNSGAKWLYFPADYWTSGFFPATLYALNTRRELCGTTEENGLGRGDWLALGRELSNGLVPLEEKNGVGHDVGFLSFPFAHELIVNPHNSTAKKAVNAFAHLLADRYNPKVEATRSWDKKDKSLFPVIIDNMMNLEVLFLSADLTGNDTLREIAINHAKTTMINHIREDGSTWHVIEYNATTGKVIDKVTAQGYADSSTWTRGQAWGIYGFANLYKHTKIPSFLSTSQRLATYFVDHLPEDKIVPWDFQAPLSPAPRPADSSAATIAAYALLTLSELVESEEEREKWIGAAREILNSITKLAWNPSWQSLLSNGTVYWSQGNFDTGTVYGDYYFVMAGNKLIEMGLAECS